MDGYRPDVVRMGFKLGYLLTGVEVVNSDLEIIGTYNDPVLSRYKFTSSHWDITDIDCFHFGACIVGPDLNFTGVQCGQHPWLCWMEINALDTIRMGRQ